MYEFSGHAIQQTSLPSLRQWCRCMTRVQNMTH